MKAINELLKNQAKLEKEIADLSNGQARVGTRKNTIEIDTTGMSEENARSLFYLASERTNEFIRVTREHKYQELGELNDVLNQVENLLGELS